jgi:hypothetical protein
MGRMTTRIYPYIMGNKKCSKPPIRYIYILIYIYTVSRITATPCMFSIGKTPAQRSEPRIIHGLCGPFFETRVLGEVNQKDVP